MGIEVHEYVREDGSNLTRLGSIISIGGGTERGQQRDIDRAKALLAEYKARKKAAVAQQTKEKKRWH